MPGGGSLTLATHLGQNVFEVQVSDTGIGIAPEASEKIFNPFYTTKEHSVGLGLTIVHNIVAAHQGTIHMASTPGKGTTFTLLFPLAPPASEDKRPQHVHDSADLAAK